MAHAPDVHGPNSIPRPAKPCPTARLVGVAVLHDGDPVWTALGAGYHSLLAPGWRQTGSPSRDTTMPASGCQRALPAPHTRDARIAGATRAGGPRVLDVMPGNAQVSDQRVGVGAVIQVEAHPPYFSP